MGHDSCGVPIINLRHRNPKSRASVRRRRTRKQAFVDLASEDAGPESPRPSSLASDDTGPEGPRPASLASEDAGPESPRPAGRPSSLASEDAGPESPRPSSLASENAGPESPRPSQALRPKTLDPKVTAGISTRKSDQNFKTLSKLN